MANLICLGGGLEALPILRRARELGHRLIVVDHDPEAPGFVIANQRLAASCYHQDETLSALDRLGENYAGVLCCAVDAPHVAAAVAARFGLPGLTARQAGLSVDKWAQIRRLHGAGLPVPPHYFLGSENDVLPGSVVKPVDSRGGRGVIRTFPGLDPAWAYAQAKAQSPTGRVMAEAWLSGPQLSTESIMQDGEVLFTAVGLRNYARLDEFAPYVIEDGFDEPCDADGEISGLISQAVRALGWYQSGGGMVKGDLVIHDGKFHILELAARLSGGFFATHGHALAYGVDFVGHAVNLALGYRLREGEIKPYLRGFVCQRYVFPGPEEIGRRVQSVRETNAGWPMTASFASWNVQPGAEIRPVRSHPDRLGQALAVGRTFIEARTKAEQAVSDMRSGLILA